MIYFRLLPLLTAICALLLAFLIGLGVWQLERLQWKLALIDQVERNMRAAPLTLDEALAKGADAQYRRVTLRGRFDNAYELYIFGATDAGQVFHVVTPFTTDDHRTLLIDRGIVPENRRDPATRRAGLVEGETTVTGVWRNEDQPGTFTPPPDTAKRLWFVRSASGMARTANFHLAAPVIIEADATPNSGGWPKGGQTVIAFRNEHLQYALTWFLMAAGLLGVYLAYHVSRDRLGLKRQD
ncbi:MAG: SURF1 family protein [Alphaproteobacteria bacterium]|nr:SURF1 family protein [Alphaproteobacteria bacterium]